ncbi:MAG: TlpA family protein disulfide reductase [Planctomycetales bacterium]|nr:TlpA family protein disulfide reductase [Planctomycetales bacterium]
MSNTRLASVLLIASLLSAGCNRAEPEKINTGSLVKAGESPSDRAGVDSGVPVLKDSLQAQPLDGEESRVAPTLGEQENVAPKPEIAQLVPKSNELPRTFELLQPNPTTVPAELLDHIREIDRAIQELVRLGMNDAVDEQSYVAGGLRLGRLKHEAGGRLASLNDATDEERRAGLIAQLVALSHMSGLRDVEAAKELQRFAEQLSHSEDAGLAHQSRVVLLGFEVQALQNGIKKDPNDLLAQVEGLFTSADQRNFPEFMALQNAAQVLQQMDFMDASRRVMSILASEFIDADDPQLRGEAWALATQGSQSIENLLNAMKPLGTGELDAPSVAAAARAMIQEFPNCTTLEQLAETLTSIEYSGQIGVSIVLADEVRRGMQSIQGSQRQIDGLHSKLASHDKRVGLLNQPFSFESTVSMDGNPVNTEQLMGKVVLVDFWASWCIPCTQEISDFVKPTYEKFHEQGFEVVGISMDDNLQQAENWIASHRLRWQVLRPSDLSALSFDSEIAMRQGVIQIPFQVLLGRDGKVAEMHVRGANLAAQVERLLGE